MQTPSAGSALSRVTKRVIAASPVVKSADTNDENSICARADARSGHR